jgi:hypothetical protein
VNNNLINYIYLTMAVSKTIFNNGSSKQTFSQIERLDNGQMTLDEETYFNTYRHWEPFFVPTQNALTGTKDEKGDPQVEAVPVKGTKSLFNNVNAVITAEEFRIDANMPLLDSPSNREKQRRNTACTIKDLVDASSEGLMGLQIYNYSDFAYCKYLGKFPNNYLVTLRRFGTPCSDKIDMRTYSGVFEFEKKAQNHAPDIGRLITWMGTPGNEINSILKYNYGVNWDEQTAEINDIESKGDEEGKKLMGLFNLTNPDYRKLVMNGQAGANFAGKEGLERIVGSGNMKGPYNKATWDSMYDTTKVYGPVDVIDKTKKRKRGLVFEQKFQLTFDYELRSYYGVNGKAAMIDLLGNILATTYTHGKFWAGERRFIGAAQDNIFANLPVFKTAMSGAEDDNYSMVESFWGSVHEGVASILQRQPGETNSDKISNLAKDLGGMVFSGLLNKLGRPHKYALASLLSGAPVGCWHLTIGNPKSPILEIGNLVCTNSEIEHYGPLGLDDFPTGIRVKVSLEHGKPRDITGIEQMYGRGDTRMYAPMGGQIMEMYKNSKKVDDNSKTKPHEGSTQEKMTDPNQTSTSADNIGKTPNYDERALKRYFGTADNETITKAASEALYGGEAHKNDHVKKGTSKVYA